MMKYFYNIKYFIEGRKKGIIFSIRELSDFEIMYKDLIFLIKMGNVKSFEIKEITDRLTLITDYGDESKFKIKFKGLENIEEIEVSGNNFLEF